VKIGEINTLEIQKETAIGLFLSDDLGMEVLLPKRYVPKKFQVGDKLDVFIYRDSEDRLISTTETPRAQLRELGWMTVKSVTEAGAFLDWGLSKDLFVPLKEQVVKLKEGETHLVYVYLDDLTQRLAASPRLERFLKELPEGLEKGSTIKATIWKEHHPLGFQVIVNDKYLGMVYANQVFQDLKIGETLNAYVNAVRDDGRIDVMLQKPGHESIDDASKELIDALEKSNGFLPLTDKSSPEDIYSTLSMSKKSFKKAVGSLYKSRIIELQNDGIKLL
jgi:uncharacterized protein